MIYLSSPHMSPREREYLLDAFDSNWVAPLGPYVDRFEADLAKYVDMPYAVALSSGTAALHLGLLVLGVKPGDLVLTSSLTFVATANAIKYTGATPVFIDSEPDSWNMDPGLLEEELARERVAAVMPVDLYGRCCDYEKIQDICARYEVPILEDAAEALGAEYQGRKAGNFGKLAAFSFNGNKIMTTGGGGALVSHDKSLIDKARYLSTQAKIPAAYYQHEEVGFNYRMSNLLAAIGCGQLEVLDEHIERRREINKTYGACLPELQRRQVRLAEGNCWLTTMTCDNPEALRQYLFEHQIESRPIWKPMHLQPLYKDCRRVGGSVAEKIFETGLCLPSGSALSFDQQSYVIETIHEFYRENT